MMRSVWPWAGGGAPQAARAGAERRGAGPGFGALGWALLALSLALSPVSRAQEVDQSPPSEPTPVTTRPSEPEPGPEMAVEQVSESSASADSTEAVDESNDGDDSDRSEESGPLQGETAAEVFVPTEEISEDFAVPFPVDI